MKTGIFGRRRQTPHRRLIAILIIVLIFLLWATVIFESGPTVIPADSLYNFTLPKPMGRFAYVQYVTSPHYVCYAAVNVHRLIFDVKADPDIDIVLLATEASGVHRLCPQGQCPFPQGRVKIKMVSNTLVETGRRLVHDSYYKDCYIRLEAFGLYKDYDRIVTIDADGLIMKNLDHLFLIDLENHSLAATFAYYEPQDYISSVLMVIDLSESMYDQVRSYFTPQKLDEIAALNLHHNHFDMDIINHMFKRGNLTKLLPKRYALMDTYFFNDDQVWNSSKDTDLYSVYYIHFCYSRKPLLNTKVTLPWMLQVMLSNSMSAHANASAIEPFTKRVYYPFWKMFDRYCRPWLTNIILPKITSDWGS